MSRQLVVTFFFVLLVSELRADSKPVALQGHSDSVWALSFSPDGQTIATAGGNDKTIRLWRADTGKMVATLAGSTLPVSCLAFHPKASQIVSGGTDPGIKPKGELVLWDTDKGRLIDTLKIKPMPGVSCVAFSPNGEFLAAGARRTHLKLINFSDRKVKEDYPRGDRFRVNSLAFVPTEVTTLVTGEATNWAPFQDMPLGWRPPKECEGRLCVVDYKTNKSAFVPLADRAGAFAVACSPNGKMLAVGTGDGDVLLMDVKKFSVYGVLHGFESAVLAVAFSPNGDLLAAGGADRTVKLWNLASRKEVALIQDQEGAVRSLAFSPNGKTLATASGKTPLLWDVISVIAERRPPPPLVFEPPVLPNARVGENYRQPITAKGGTPPHKHFTICLGNPPPGLSLSPDGILSGVPKAGGTFTFTVSALDSRSGGSSDRDHGVVVDNQSSDNRSLSEQFSRLSGWRRLSRAPCLHGRHGTVHFRPRSPQQSSACGSDPLPRWRLERHSDNLRKFRLHHFGHRLQHREWPLHGETEVHTDRQPAEYLAGDKGEQGTDRGSVGFANDGAGFRLLAREAEASENDMIPGGCTSPWSATSSRRPNPVRTTSMAGCVAGSGITGLPGTPLNPRNDLLHEAGHE